MFIIIIMFLLFALKRDFFLATPCAVLSHTVLSAFLQPYGLLPARLPCPQNSPGKNTGVGCHALPQGIFPTQGSNQSLFHCRQILYHLSPQVSPGSPSRDIHNNIFELLTELKPQQMEDISILWASQVGLVVKNLSPLQETPQRSNTDHLLIP